MDDLYEMLKSDEEVKWEGKPDKRTFIFESVFNPFAGFALIWIIVAVGIITCTVLFGDKESIPWFFLVPFFAVWLMPVWAWIGTVLTAFLRYKQIYYMITDRRVLTRHGCFSVSYASVPVKRIVDVHTNRSMSDRMFGVGDVSFSVAGHAGEFHTIDNVEDHREVMAILEDLTDDRQGLEI